MRHECHAHDCKREIPPRLLMCGRHWRLVPPAVRELVWSVYRKGQEITKDPTTAYLAAHHLAIAHVARAEGYTKAAEEHRRYSEQYAAEAKAEG